MPRSSPSGLDHRPSGANARATTPR
jgi:hypothetical protein